MVVVGQYLDNHIIFVGVNSKGVSNIINDIQISKHFKLSEFESGDTKEVKIDPELIEKLEKLRQRIGQPLVINSGYRTPEHNERVGGSPKSQHVEGRAADIREVKGLSIDEMAILAESIGFGGIGKYSWGIHVDVRGEKARWDYRKE